MASMKELKSIARELNTVLGLTPPISVTLGRDELTAQILEASEEVEEGDDLRETTRTLLAALQADQEKVSEEEAKELIQEEEASEKPAKPVQEAPPKKSAAKKATQESPPKKEKKMTWADALAASLRETKGKAFTTQEIVEATQKRYGEKSNVSGAVSKWDVVRGILLVLHILEKHGKGQYKFVGK